MCQYTKDNGEQCGRDTEPFCFQHEETEQALAYAYQQRSEDVETPEVPQIDTDDNSGVVSGSNGTRMESVCSNCRSALRRCERLTEHPNFGGRMLFEAYGECDCDEYVLGSKSVRTSKLPDGWQ